MSYAFMPLYTGDYLRDTRDLTQAEHGCYFLLLMYSWDERGPLPLDEELLATIGGVRAEADLKVLRRILERFWVRADDGWYNPRNQRELDSAAARSEVRAEAGRKGGVVAAKRRERWRKAKRAQRKRELLDKPAEGRGHVINVRDDVIADRAMTRSVDFPSAPNESTNSGPVAIASTISISIPTTTPSKGFGISNLPPPSESADGKAGGRREIRDENPKPTGNGRVPYIHEWWTDEQKTRQMAEAVGVPNLGTESWADWRHRIFARIRQLKHEAGDD